MSIEIDGITYEEPSDKATATVAQIDYLLASIGDAMKRVAKTAYAEVGHDHSNDILYPTQIRRETSDTYLYIHGAAGSYLQLANEGSVQWTIATGKRFDVLGASRIRADTSFTYALELTGTENYRKGRADAWEIYSCSERDKENLVEIWDPITKLKNLRGLTFTRNGVADTGIVVEDLEKTGLPGIIHKVASKIEAWNPVPIIGLLIASMKELIARVEALEMR